MEVIAVTLGDSDIWSHHKKLLDLGFANINSATFSAPKTAKSLNALGGEKSTVKLNCESFTVGLTPEEQERITYRISLPEFLFAPLKRGETVGKIDYYLDNRIFKSLNLTLVEDIQGLPSQKKDFLCDLLINLKTMLKL